ncbi:hypothetical protein KM1_152720 [Entamoeba histolytica HM-3:IMSS]|uniref:Uncharacterized protein n=6 Tax=Entamoeba histolytica TaxID=5759 RepID=C4LY35_ENTH1|nr:hypothetical protein EHI_177310 [Entamoeba histolytica HM-1:IMSS]EMD47903.1 Hypothetical protein EHI5A_084380 [Entamoeba histolytica KU27]EMS14892.1 hypothetical protein KM1_152720 [Entamoeba histolytica HM-3:IMSS]ENY61794.1 hypothetical protein EHI7A_085110 [Entamoeba histolytica HM-1:IMSS-A]GAT93688.1 hypothetical protein CL6EHI_177310 [Entamoeba histolytica]EAL43336.1 hypothetical protein EHI_177310 [Entamoeba histolytica HM-1:IMSS]|eukprot:XP_648722.1 hypothetical protein EHI_177310 [Entamoeba histolytica HM-1:IMSS]
MLKIKRIELLLLFIILSTGKYIGFFPSNHECSMNDTCVALRKNQFTYYYKYKGGDEHYERINSIFRKIEKDFNYYSKTLSNEGKKYLDPIRTCFGRLKNSYNSFKSEMTTINPQVEDIRSKYENCEDTVKQLVEKQTEDYYEHLKNENEFDNNTALVQANQSLSKNLNDVNQLASLTRTYIENPTALLKSLTQQFAHLKKSLLACKGDRKQIEDIIKSSPALKNWNELIDKAKVANEVFIDLWEGYLYFRGFKCNTAQQDNAINTLKDIVKKRTRKFNPSVQAKVEHSISKVFDDNERDIIEHGLHLENNFYTQSDFKEKMLAKWNTTYSPTNVQKPRKSMGPTQILEAALKNAKKSKNKELVKELTSKLKMSKLIDDKSYRDNFINQAGEVYKKQLSGEYSKEKRKNWKEDIAKAMKKILGGKGSGDKIKQEIIKRLVHRHEKLVGGGDNIKGNNYVNTISENNNEIDKVTNSQILIRSNNKRSKAKLLTKAQRTSKQNENKTKNKKIVVQSRKSEIERRLDKEIAQEMKRQILIKEQARKKILNEIKKEYNQKKIRRTKHEEREKEIKKIRKLRDKLDYLFTKRESEEKDNRMNKRIRELKTMISDHFFKRKQLRKIYNKMKYSVDPIQQVNKLVELYHKQNKMMGIHSIDDIYGDVNSNIPLLRKEERKLLHRMGIKKKQTIDYDDVIPTPPNEDIDNPEEKIIKLERQVNQQKWKRCGCGVNYRKNF